VNEKQRQSWIVAKYVNHLNQAAVRWVLGYHVGVSDWSIKTVTARQYWAPEIGVTRRMFSLDGTPPIVGGELVVEVMCSLSTKALTLKQE